MYSTMTTKTKIWKGW